MKLNTKIIILITTALVLTSTSIGLISTWRTYRTGNDTVAQIERMGRDNLQRIKADGEREAVAYREEMLALKKEYLKSEVQTAMSILEAVEKEPGLSPQDKQQKASGLVKALRYGPENKDYFWINDLHPTMIMHPYKPEMDGKDLSDNKDPNGKKLFVEFARVAKEKGEGFVDYLWPKYGADKPQPKLSFVALFKEWGWVVGTGLYIDDIDALMNAKKAEMEKRLQAEASQLNKEIEATKQEIQNSVRSVVVWISGITLAVLMVVLIVSIVFTRRSITRPVSRIIESLNEGADQVASAAGQISSTSQQLAEGASEQAASIEETSSSLEEMSSMTRQNADNAQQARQHDGGSQASGGPGQGFHGSAEPVHGGNHPCQRRHLEDHQDYRRDRLPDQPPGPERSRGSRAGGRGRSRFCGGGRRSQKPGHACRRCGQEHGQPYRGDGRRRSRTDQTSCL